MADMREGRQPAVQSLGNRLLSGAAACLAMSTLSLTAACDNGGSASPGGVETPTPSPSASASPTPAPVATSFPLGAATEFYAMAAHRPGSELAVVEPRLDRIHVVPSYLATDGFVIREGAEETVFTVSDLVSAPTPNAPRYGYRKPGASASSYNGLDALNNTNANSAVSDPNRRLRWTSYAAWYRDSSAGTQKNITYAVFGFPTSGDRLPQTAEIGYRAFGFGIGGSAFPNPLQSVDLTNVSVNINRSKRRISVSFTYNYSGNVSSFYGIGAIIPGTNRFSGQSRDGMFHGEFFGPDAEEIGLVFASNRTVAAVLGIRN